MNIILTTAVIAFLGISIAKFNSGERRRAQSWANAMAKRIEKEDTLAQKDNQHIS